MAGEAHQALIRRLTEEVWNQGKLDVLDELYAPDARSQSVATFKEVVRTFRTAFPDLEMRAEQVISSGNAIAVHWRLSGTHQGSLQGLSPTDTSSAQPVGEDRLRWPLDSAPTGKPVRLDGVSFLQLQAGRIVSAWVLVDRLSVLHQLGILPTASRMSP